MAQKSSVEAAPTVLHEVSLVCVTSLEHYEEKNLWPLLPDQVLLNELPCLEAAASLSPPPPSGILNWQDLKSTMPRLDPSL